MKVSQRDRLKGRKSRIFVKHSLKLALKLPSDKSQNNEFLETFAKVSLKATLRLR